MLKNIASLRTNEKNLSNLNIVFSPDFYIFGLAVFIFSIDPDQSIRALIIGALILIYKKLKIEGKIKYPKPTAINISTFLFVFYSALRLYNYPTFKSIQYFFVLLLSLSILYGTIYCFQMKNDKRSIYILPLSFLLSILMGIFYIVLLPSYYNSNLLEFNRYSTSIGILALPVLGWSMLMSSRDKLIYYLLVLISIFLLIYVFYGYGATLKFSLLCGILGFGTAKIIKRSALVVYAVLFSSIIIIQPWWGEFLRLTIYPFATTLLKGSAIERIEIWRIYGEVLKHDPWWGLGFGASQDIVLTPLFETLPQALQSGFVNRDFGFHVHAHNNVLQIWGELGIIGIILFWLIIMSLVKKMYDLHSSIYPYAFGFLCATTAAALEYDRLWHTWWLSMINIGIFIIYRMNQSLKHENS